MEVSVTNEWHGGEKTADSVGDASRRPEERSRAFNFLVLHSKQRQKDLKCYCDQKTLLGFLRISRLCLQNNPHAKF